MSNKVLFIASVLFMVSIFVFAMSIIAYKNYKKEKLRRSLRRKLLVQKEDISLRELFNWKFEKIENIFIQAGIDTVYIEDVLIFLIIFLSIIVGISILFNFGMFLLIVPIVLMGCFIGFVKKRATKRIETINNQFCEALDDLADDLRVNGNLYISIKNSLPSMQSPLKEEFELVCKSVESNIDIIVALQTFSDRIGNNVIQGWVDAIIFASEKKANVADVCKKYTKKVRKRLRVSKEVKGKLQGIKFMALMIAGILGFMLIGFYSSSPEFMAFLQTGIGKGAAIYTLTSIILTTLFVFNKIDKEVADI